jgi:GH15 family glucan-1,4-alpha-glucosidase
VRSEGGTMYKKIGDYGGIGNMQSVALVGKDGSIDWLCLPKIDSPSVFAALLDADDGGFFSVTPEGEWDSVLSYREDSNVLVGSFRTRSGRYTLTDFMTIPDRNAPPSAQRDFALIRLLKVERGTVRVRVSFQPRFDYGRVIPVCTLAPGCGVVATGNGEQVSLCTGREMEIVNGMNAEGLWELAEGERVAMCLRYSGDPEQLAEEKAERFLVETLAFWREWLYSGGTGFYNDLGPHRNQVVRSLLVLKLLCYHPYGTMAAAATTSLPEEIGGVRNWDYRFSWVRDTCMALTALFEVGHVGEAQSYLDWLHEIIGKNERRELQVMYRMDGATNLEEFELPHLEGFRGSQPVRIGNLAAEQKQFSIYGNVLIAAHLVVSRNRSIKPDTWNGLRLMADYAQRQWREPDWSIWEMRAEPQHFIHSKVMCWVTLDRCLRIARATNSEGDIELWQETRDEIHREVMTRGWNEKRQAFVLHYDTDALDGSTLLMSMCGFISYDHPRMLATVEALRMDLGHRGFIYRYFADDGLPGREGTFLACTLWLITNLAKQGELDEAEHLLKKVDRVAGPLHLLAEEYDPQWQEQLGNFPQAFSHEAYITAATAIAHAKGEQLRRAEEERYILPDSSSECGPAPDARELADFLDELSRECCKGGRPDYTAFKAGGFPERLITLLHSLQAFCPERLKAKEERISFWCNLYNLLLLHGILAAGIELSV